MEYLNTTGKAANGKGFQLFDVPETLCARKKDLKCITSPEYTQ